MEDDDANLKLTAWGSGQEAGMGAADALARLKSVEAAALRAIIDRQGWSDEALRAAFSVLARYSRDVGSGFDKRKSLAVVKPDLIRSGDTGLADGSSVFAKIEVNVNQESKPSWKGRDSKGGQYNPAEDARSRPTTPQVERGPKPGYGNTAGNKNK